MEQIQRLRPEGLVSSPAFSHVATVPPGATTIYVGGQNSVDQDGAIVGEDDVAAGLAVPGAFIEVGAIAAVVR